MDKILTAMTIVLWLAIGFLLGVAAGAEAATEGSFLERWQTLLAGVLAVLAGGWTINTMMRTDNSQQKRHEQLMRLNTRRDALALDRSLPVARTMIDIGNGLLELARLAEQQLSEKRPGVFHAEAKRLEDLLNRSDSSRNSDRIKDAADIFTGHIGGLLDQSVGQVTDVRNARLEFFGSDVFTGAATPSLGELKRLVEILGNTMISIGKEITDLSKRYREGAIAL